MPRGTNGGGGSGRGCSAVRCVQPPQNLSYNTSHFVVVHASRVELEGTRPFLCTTHSWYWSAPFHAQLTAAAAAAVTAADLMPVGGGGSPTHPQKRRRRRRRRRSAVQIVSIHIDWHSTPPSQLATASASAAIILLLLFAHSSFLIASS